MGTFAASTLCRALLSSGAFCAIGLSTGMIASAADAEVAAQVPQDVAEVPQDAAASPEQDVAIAPAEASASGPAERQDIVVTGTRIAGFNAPTPVTALNQQQLQAKAARSVSELLLDIPALRFNQNTGTVSSPTGASNLDLRALGPNRTLLLVDGRRFAATDPTGGVDINVIPAVLINKIEIVTGGASAAYGSDAVSGVVNITLDDRFEGIKGDVQYGQTTYDDVHEPGASLAVGKSFMDGRLHLVAAGDVYKNTGQSDQSSRPWGRKDYAVLTNPAFAPGNGQPQRLILPGSTTSQLTFGGVTALSNIAALRGIQFGPGGTVLPFEYGSNVGTSLMTGGSGARLTRTANILPRYNRQSGFGRASFDLTANVSIYADVLYSRNEASADQTPNLDSGTIRIRRDNAYLPAAVAAIMDANRVATLQIGRINAEDGVFKSKSITEVLRYSGGAEGTFGGSWKWSGFAQLTRNDYTRDDQNNRITANFLNAVDAVVNPATGRIVCRSTLTNANNGCVPANLFGAGSISREAVNYYTGTSRLRSSQSQDLYAVNLTGKPFSIWAGDVSIAVGGEYRREAVRATSDPISQASGWRQINAQPLNGSYNVKEAFGEIVVPLLKDSPLGRKLDVDGAVRVTDYSTSGTVTTWKGGANYTPFDSVRFRGTISRDIRAPNVNELFSGQTQLISNIIDPLTNRSLATPQFTGGNPALQPERAKTYSAGIVIEPSFVPRLHLSVDYYSISIKDAILSLTGQQIVDACVTLGQANLCDAITRDPVTNSITRVQATLFNAAAVATNGVDIEAAYSFPLGSGSLNIRALGTYVNKLTTTINGVTTDTAGQTGATGGVPHWRGNLFINYRDDRLTAGGLIRWVQGGKFNNLYVGGIDINDNSVGGRGYLDLNAGYKVLQGVELFTKINNVFDRDPPPTPQPIVQASAAGSVFYDRIGRFISVGARFKF